MCPENGKALEDVRGNHLTGKSNLDVEFLDIGQQDLAYIPKGIEKFFKNLIGIRYKHSNLATISSDDLKPFPQLLFFGMYDTKLVSLDGNLFQNNLNLQVVSIFANKIEHIGPNLLGGLSQLKDVSFTSNVCINNYAYSMEAIKELNEQLPILCPPKIDELLLYKTENEKANKRIAELEMTIRVLASTC